MKKIASALGMISSRAAIAFSPRRFQSCASKQLLQARIQDLLKAVDGTRRVRLIIIFGVYSSILALSFCLAFLLRFEFSLPIDQQAVLWRHLLWCVPFQLAVLLGMGHCAGLLSFFSIPDLRRLAAGLAFSSAVLLALWYACAGAGLPPRSVILADFLLALLALSAIRLAFRLTWERFKTPVPSYNGTARRVGIIGAGYVGAALARELLTKRGLRMQPVAFFDDERNKWHWRVHNIPVVGSPECLATAKNTLALDEIIIAMPSAPAKRIAQIVKLLQATRLKFTSVPSLDQLATGKVISQLRAVDIADLLGRQAVTLEHKDIRKCLTHRVVMVTGAGGSIGQELCRQIAEFHPDRLLLVEQSEFALFQIEQELTDLGWGNLIEPLVADILDEERMRFIFQEFSPAVIFHAAAHKHVPMMEHQPTEALKNNAFGTACLAELAVAHEVERFVLISTDKAINPTNVMGASKRLAELYIQALQHSRPADTRFVAVRFGNVLGSSGSVVPTFKRQIAAGGPVKITHPEVTRYFMTIPEAVGLVLQSGAQGKGGEIFMLDMGKPIKIVDLARALIELSGLQPGRDIEIQYTGLRPGEKLKEEVRHGAENLVPTTHPKILRLLSEPMAMARIHKILSELEQAFATADPDQLKTLLHRALPEYRPWFPPGSREPKNREPSRPAPHRQPLTLCSASTSAS